MEQVLQTNLLGPFRLTKALYGQMVAGGGGLFVSISSDAAVNSYPRWGAYSASKSALDRITGIFDEESRGFNIRHLSLDPGDMNTEMHFKVIPDADPAQLLQPEDVARDMSRFLLAGNFSQSRYSADEWRASIRGDKP